MAARSRAFSLTPMSLTINTPSLRVDTGTPRAATPLRSIAQGPARAGTVPRTSSWLRAGLIALSFVAAQACTPAPVGQGDTAPQPQSAAKPVSPAPATSTGDASKGPQAAAPDAATTLPPAADLLDAYLLAIGGPDAVASITSLYLEGKIDTGAQQITAATKLWWSGGKFYLEEEVPGFGVAKSGYDGSVAWVSDPIFGLRTARGVEREQLIRNGAIFELVDWQRHFVSATTTGTATQDGVDLYEIELTTTMGDVVVVGLGKDDHLLHTVSLVQHSPQGDQPVKVVRSDYRALNGVMMPYKQVAQVSLFSLSEEVIKAEVNVPIDESKFSMPGAPTLVDPKGNPASVGTASDGAVQDPTQGGATDK